MKVELIDTTASTVRNELTRMCQQMGGLTTGVVLNLVIMTDEADQYDALRAATQAGPAEPAGYGWGRPSAAQNSSIGSSIFHDSSTSSCPGNSGGSPTSTSSSSRS